MRVSKFPKNLSLAKNKNIRKLWDDLIKNDLSPFKGRDYWEVFIYAMALAYSHKLQKEELKGGKDGTIPERTIKDKREAWALIKTIALTEEGINVIMDEAKIAEIAEQYANAGITLLYDKIFKAGTADPLKILETEALEYLK